METLLSNFPLWCSIFAILFAQFIKIPIMFISSRKLEWSLFFSTGGMPSSHSSGVTALTTSVGLVEGVGSTIFAITAVFSIIVMYDAKGVRWHAGEQAAVLNSLVRDFQKLTTEIKNWPKKNDEEKRLELKELLGHRPSEVFFGAILGIFLSFALYFGLGSV
ncbi:divergent PAP2 family protein [Alkalihalobacillus sp. AL-G]|uniref:divergent PAP2 family protein n=1 Tax=Alkalihalobacillus sp. AL-G TaxID=2926399 RepID=UPI00272B79BA|nr:divergent PAP2 family protein [Alkalihalobacillus sp. AL-G]WLD92674.1 divergent PAP2 family protein [Alkalihalobacillus sp. AL-G]